MHLLMVAHTAILDRIIEPQRGGFSPEHARYVLSLDFSPDEHARYAALCEMAQAGTLSDQERADLDDFLAVNALLTILQAKARISLKKHVPAA
jgi:hypothetical protein